jgi:hypothetical protein
MGTVWKYRYELALEAAKAWDFDNGDCDQVMSFWVEWAEIDQGQIDQRMTDALGEMLAKYGVQTVRFKKSLVD